MQNLFTLHFGNSSWLNNFTNKSILTLYRSFSWYHAAFLSRLILSSHSFFFKILIFSQGLADVLSMLAKLREKLSFGSRRSVSRNWEESFCQFTSMLAELRMKVHSWPCKQHFFFFPWSAMVTIAARASESVQFRTKHECKNASLFRQERIVFLKKVLPEQKHKQKIFQSLISLN